MLVFHIFCCGALLGVLIASGSLFFLRQEGRNQVFLLPALGLAIVVFWWQRHHSHCCEEKGEKSLGDHFVSLALSLFFSLLLGTIFIVYVFIPWWIPNYQGGMLLP